MSDTVIRVENLSKKYIIDHQVQRGYKTLREKFTQTTQSLAQKLIQPGGKKSEPLVQEEFWALKDVSFDIKEGEIVGIIGRNGAGKSTLLKLLSRITEPTTGEIKLKGRVASLLEVGTGFHPELTGRENIYLNGAILGMSKAEIKNKFDEIVAFSEVEKFLDTPVKRYSSGMYVRLAFAVAAHLEPEILIVDEVLAVGDAAFQKKCLGKMGDVSSQEGRTVLFVSHNMAAIQSLCERAFWLNAGRLVDRGPKQQVIQNYLQSALIEQDTPLDQRQDRSGDGSVRLISVSIESTDPDKVIYSGSRLKITIRYRSQARLLYPYFWISVYDYVSHNGLFALTSQGINGFPESLPPEGDVTCITDPINLTPRRCFINLTLEKGSILADRIERAAFFDVEYKDFDGTGKTCDWMLTAIKHRWSIQVNSSG